MTVSFDGQSGAVAPPAGTILWAEEGIGAYERSVGGTHGTDVPVRVDRSLIGKRNIETGAVTSDDFDWQKVAPLPLASATRVMRSCLLRRLLLPWQVTWCEAEPRQRAALLAKQLGIATPVLRAEGPFAYGLVARAEAQAYLELPDEAAAFDAHIWSHAAGALLVTEAGGLVTDTAGNPLDFSMSGESRTLGRHVVGTIATNKDLHPHVVRALGTAAAEAAMA